MNSMHRKLKISTGEAASRLHAISDNKIEKALSDLRMGKMVIVIDDEDRENEGDLVMVAEKATPAAINFMAKEGRGLICVPISKEIADRLELPPMVNKNTETLETNFTVSVDYRFDTTTGISASERAKTIKALASPKSKPSDFRRPGHIFPLRSRAGGVLIRAGHTEAATDMAKLAGFSPVGVICEITQEDGEMARLPYLIDFAKKHGLKIITIRDLISHRSRREKFVERKAESFLPTAFGDFKLIVYKSIIDNKEHIALVKGVIETKKPVTVRVHSECLTGEVFNSLRCDCRLQLEEALRIIAGESAGVFVYMRQEGRGIGLMNKIKAYKLQDDGYDTVEANKMLGFKADLREYGIGAQILADLGVGKMKLLTNNPRKIVGLEGYGLKIVEIMPLEVPPNRINRNYLATKKTRLGHLLNKYNL